MKNYLVISFFLVSGMVFCQKSETLKLSRTQLSKINLLSEIVKYDIKKTSPVSWEVVAKVHGKLVSMAGVGRDSLSKSVKSILIGADMGSKIYFDILIDPNKSKSDKSNIQTFAILVVD